MAISNAEALSRLMALPTIHDLPIEPPRRSLAAWAVMKLSSRLGTLSATPQQDLSLWNEADTSKAAYEYGYAEEFWIWFDGHISARDLADKDVLDAGCGWGGKAVYFAEHSGLRSMTAFDIAWDMSAPEQFARERGVESCRFLNASVEEMPFEDESFDVVLMEDVLEHVTDPARALEECARVLRPGGRLFLRFPSIKMMFAHHFDRVTLLPGIHRVIPMKTFVAGFNYEIAANGLQLLPFSQIETRFGREVCCDLAGMDLRDFERIAVRSSFEVEHLEMAPFPGANVTPIREMVLYPAYHALRRLPWFDELLSATVAFIGRKPS
jgi:2-polyprenyl-3-methyl-5-hydroxy-6-metoxy-1,4-benzoquinol methylase